jgi:hypothetical protein
MEKNALNVIRSLDDPAYSELFTDNALSLLIVGLPTSNRLYDTVQWAPVVYDPQNKQGWQHTLVFYNTRTRSIHSIKFDLRYNRGFAVVFLCQIDFRRLYHLVEIIKSYGTMQYRNLDADEYVYLLVDQLFSRGLIPDTNDWRDSWKEALAFRREMLADPDNYIESNTKLT